MGDMKIKYVVARVTAEGPDRLTGKTSLRRARRKMRLLTRVLRGPFSFKVDGSDESWSHPFEGADARARIDLLFERLRTHAVGSMFKMKNVASGRVFWVRKVGLLDPVPHIILPSQATAAGTAWRPVLREVYADVFSRQWANGQPDFYGAYNCRLNRIAGAGWSQHCYWPDTNAIDIGIGNNLALGDEIYSYVANKYGDVLGGPQGAGVTNCVWREPNHFNHIHVEGWPYFADPHSRPACAR